VSETDKTEFQCCLGQWILHINDVNNDFNLGDYRPVVKVLFFLYLSEHDEDF
jgi:hypothetical protein